MKKILSIVLVSMFAATSVLAANEDAKKETSTAEATMVRTISGKVVDKTTGEALAGASVKLDDNTVVYTDFEGNFAIKLTQPKAKVSVSLISYSTTDVEINKNSKEVKIELVTVE